MVLIILKSLDIPITVIKRTYVCFLKQTLAWFNTCLVLSWLYQEGGFPPVFTTCPCWYISLMVFLDNQRLRSPHGLVLSTYVLSHFSRVWLFVNQWTVAPQALLPVEFSRQEYWSGLPCPSPGDLPDPGVKPTSLTSPSLAGGFLSIGGVILFQDQHISWGLV